MVNDQQIIFVYEFLDGKVSEFLQGTFVPTDFYMGMQFVEPLGGSDDGHVAARVIPGNPV
jgi:hypothetical protein